MQIYKLDPNDAVGWSLMPTVLYRTEKFCIDLDTETKPKEASDLLRSWFILNDPKLAFWLVLDDHGLVVGHLWATPEPFGLEDRAYEYVLIRQAKIDPGVNIGDTSKVVFDEVKTWAQALGVKKLMMLTHRPADVMARRWGFAPFKSLMKLDLQEDINGR